MRNRLNHLLDPLRPTRRSIAPDKRLLEDLGFDSLRVMKIIATVEDDFGITISLKRLARVRTVGDIYELVEEHLSTQPVNAASGPMA